MNLFIINSMSKETPIVETYKGVLPLSLPMLRVVLLVAFPPVTLGLVWFLDWLAG